MRIQIIHGFIVSHSICGVSFTHPTGFKYGLGGTQLKTAAPSLGTGIPAKIALPHPTTYGAYSGPDEVWPSMICLPTGGNGERQRMIGKKVERMVKEIHEELQMVSTALFWQWKLVKVR